MGDTAGGRYVLLEVGFGSRQRSGRSKKHDEETPDRLPDGQIVYRFPKPQPDGATQVRLTPLELIERLAALIPPPRIHRHRYHGVLVPNAPQVTAWALLFLIPPSPAPLPAWGSRPAPRALPGALALGAAVGAHL